jgi:hypothetical protein
MSALFALAVGALIAGAAAGATIDLPATGNQPVAVDSAGKQQPLYQSSYALIINESKYLGVARSGWRPLLNTGKELDEITQVLRAQGFQVRRMSDATGAELYQGIRKFLSDYGQNPENRILFIFSGHGYTNEKGFGYLVPIDAKDPNIDKQDFVEKALPIQQLTLLAQEATSRHVLFLFDSCFSGSIFMTKGPSLAPDSRVSDPRSRDAFFLGAGRQSVRQFIAAGGPKEELPEHSIFIPLLTKVLSGDAPISKDGYVTGKQLGLWLEQNLPAFSDGKTSPHSDVVRDPELVFGDMVFQITAFRAMTNYTGKITGADSSPVREGSLPTVSADLKTPHYRALVQKRSGSSLLGVNEVTYWREENEIYAEVVGSLQLPPNRKDDEEDVCGVRLSVSKHVDTNGGWTFVASSPIKEFPMKLKKSDLTAPIGPLRFLIKVDSAFDPDMSWLTLTYYFPEKGIFGGLKCDSLSMHMQQPGKGLFLSKDLLTNIASRTSSAPLPQQSTPPSVQQQPSTVRIPIQPMTIPVPIQPKSITVPVQPRSIEPPVESK